MKRVFITGIAGFLGSHLADDCVEQGYAVKGCDNLIGGYRENIPREAIFTVADCTDLKTMRELTCNIDTLYHCAAYPHEGLSVFSPSLITKSIYQSTATVLSAFIQNKGKRFIYLSSMARYGVNSVPFTEDMKTSPQDPYGISKVASEELVSLMARVHGFEYVIAVPHNIIGPRQKYDDPFRNVVSIFINRMLQGKQPIIYGDGKQKRCFSFIKDCIASLRKMAIQNNMVNETINIGPDEEFITINELAETIARLLDFQLKPIYVPDRPQEIKEAFCSADKARRFLDYKTHYSLDDGLREMIAWIKKRGPRPFNYHLEIEIINEKTPTTWTNRLM